ncbi:MAG: alpha-glucosidase [Gaiellaceae bacterium]|jgi:alpha-glucosidase|nr:alpha-glucosidase [Gaiellaceae bacterium]
MTATQLASGTSLLSEPHHDGSDEYVLERPDELGGEAVVRLRAPRGSVDDVILRYVRDGEPRWVRAQVDHETETETWWRASFPVSNPSTSYRWVLVGPQGGLTWLNGNGRRGHESPDGDDFVLALGDGPAWHLSSVVYEIFPDRFATSQLGVEPPDWAVPRAWNELPTGRGPNTPREWFGGDLRGIEQRLDYIEQLGVSALYLTPIFPASSTHRYDATSFDRIDPLLGGDEALRSLLVAAHARGVRVISDLTTNHTGNGHEWFVDALADPNAPERELYYFDPSLPAGYESWLGIPSLPKLDWRSVELRRRMVGVTRRWLEVGLDGWRIDVANMTGRYRGIELTREVAQLIRGALTADALLVAEHGYDFRRDLDGTGWHGAMNYAGFLRPVWSWLLGENPPAELRRSFWGMPVGVPRVGGGATVGAMRAFRAGLPWQSALHSWTLLDSHDTARFRTVSGSREQQLVGMGMQMTSPGVPMVFAGDELGLEGEWGEDARRTMPWDAPNTWDRPLLAEFKRLIALRRSSDALARGGIRYVHVSDDAIAFLRESPSERLLILATRAPHDPIRLGLDAHELEPLLGGERVAVDGTAELPGDGPAFHVWRMH